METADLISGTVSFAISFDWDKYPRNMECYGFCFLLVNMLYKGSTQNGAWGINIRVQAEKKIWLKWSVYLF